MKSAAERWLGESVEAFETLYCSKQLTAFDLILFGEDLYHELNIKNAFSMPLSSIKEINRIKINRIKFLGYEWHNVLDIWAHKDV